LPGALSPEKVRPLRGHDDFFPFGFSRGLSERSRAKPACASNF
jgi:hypothetical protein